MKPLLLALLIVFLVPIAHTRNRQNHRGRLLRMESVPCGPNESAGISKAIFGAPLPEPQPEQRLCPEYILEAEGLYYRIRPRDHKHPVLLPIGEQAQFHFQKDRMLLQIEDFDDAAFEFSV